MRGVRGDDLVARPEIDREGDLAAHAPTHIQKRQLLRPACVRETGAEGSSASRLPEYYSAAFAIGLDTTGGGRLNVSRPALKPKSGVAIPATASPGDDASTTTRSARPPTLMP